MKRKQLLETLESRFKANMHRHEGIRWMDVRGRIEDDAAAAKALGAMEATGGEPDVIVIGMVIVGFGTSAPELVVSMLAAMDGNPGLAIGNAYGSNIANIALILGLTALLNPVQVSSKILRKELPILTFVTLLSVALLLDLELSLFDAALLLLLLALLMVWTFFNGLKKEPDALADDIELFWYSN